MQIFEVVTLTEYPYMQMEEIVKGEKVKDVITEEKVYILVDHDSKRIWTYNGSQSAFKLQIFGGILAGEMRKQLKLFYRIFFLNAHPKEDPLVQEVMDKPLGGGRATAISKEDLPQQSFEVPQGPDLCVHPELKSSRALENLSELPPVENYKLCFRIINGNIYVEEEIPLKFMQEEKSLLKPTKVGQLNRGFMFFGDNPYSMRLYVKERKVQGLELYIPQEEAGISDVIEVNIPTFYEQRFTDIGKMELVIDAFQIPETNSDVTEEQNASPSNNQDK